MTKHDAWLYAASWGSFNNAGDPGACLYGFDADFRVQSEEHRADCLREMEGHRADVVADSAGYEPGELEQVDTFILRLKGAKLASEPGALDDADAFTVGYVDSMLWTDNAPDAESVREFEAMAASGDEPDGSFPKNSTAEDIAPHTLARIVADCKTFQDRAGAILAEVYARQNGYDAERAGHDFWLTRNAHGAGFWDREELEPEGDEYESLTRAMGQTDGAEWDRLCSVRHALKETAPGERLSALAKEFGQVDSYLGDDGLIHL